MTLRFALCALSTTQHSNLAAFVLGDVCSSLGQL